MVLSSTVMAAPSLADVIGTADEAVNYETDVSAEAELENVVSLKPGLNMLTGTAAPLTADDSSLFSSIFEKPSNSTITSAADPTGVKTGNIIKWNVPTNATTGGYYPGLGVRFCSDESSDHLESLVGHTYIHLKFDYKKYVADLETAQANGTYNNDNSFWIMNNNGSGKNISVSMGMKVTDGWKTYNDLIDLVKGGTLESKTTKKFILEAGVNKVTTVDIQFLFDNMYAVPAYEFKFYNPEGTKVIAKRYKAFGDDGNIITSYSPESGLYGNYYVTNWATTTNGAAVESINLNNENVSFYALDMAPAVTLEQQGTFKTVGDKVKIVPKVLSAVKDELKMSTSDWTIDDDTIASISRSNDGTIEVTALKSGTTMLHFTVGEVALDYELKVVLPYEVENAASAKDSFITANINPADYKALVVKLTTNAASSGAEYTLTYKIGDGDENTCNLSATSAGTRDHYIDLIDLTGWTNGTSVSFKLTSDDDASFTVESIKLYNEFDDSFKLELSADSDYLTSVGEETVVGAEFVCNLEGVYDEGFTLEVIDNDDVVYQKINNDGTVTLHAKAAKGVVTVKATSTEDSAVVATKNIYVNVDTDKYGSYYEFIEASKPSDLKIGRNQTNEGVGNTDLSIVDGKLRLVRQSESEQTNNTGGMNLNYMDSPANQKYLIVKTTGTSKLINIYYTWDRNNYTETNTVSSGIQKIENEDGTLLWVFNMANVPNTAEKITGFMLQIAAGNTADIISFYTTSEAPKAADSKTIGIKWDFEDSTSTGFAAPWGYNKGASKFEDGTLKLVANTLNGNKVEITEDTENNRYVAVTSNGGAVNSNVNMSSKGVSFDDYNYLVLKAKGNKSFNAGVTLYLNDADGATSGWSIVSISMPVTTEYGVYAFNIRQLLGKDFGENYNKMMFQYTTMSTVYSENITQGPETFTDTSDNNQQKTRWYMPELAYSNFNELTIDEMYIANYDPTDTSEKEVPLNMAVTLSASSNTITTDGGSVTVTPSVYANKKVTTTDVSYSVTKGEASIKKNDDGTLTVTAISNGEVEITAAAVEDSSFKGTITITVSGQRNKIAAYDFKYLAIGNSYLLHGYNANYSIWQKADDIARGMAASEPDLDYFHRVQYHLNEAFTGSITATRFAGSGLENSSENEETIEAATAKIEADETYKKIKNYLVNDEPNIITVQLSENFQGTGDIETNFYDVLYGMIDRYRPDESVVVVITPFGTGSRTNIIKQYAEKYGFYVADVSYVNSYNKVPATTSADYNTYIEAESPIDGTTKKYYRGDAGWKYNPYLAWAQYPGYDDLIALDIAQGKKENEVRAEFRSHPGDLGMDEIGRKVVEQLKLGVPAFLNAEYIYIPDSITISGGDSITTGGGTLSLTATVAPSDASNKVVWSVDNEIYAKISDDGKLTALNNGTVVVTAKSAYDSTVFATKTITISGQDPVYTVSYKAGTTDTVTGLPASYAYAKGNYTLSTIVPERNGYKFLGWATSENGNPTKTISVTKDTAVYAVWTLAESWHFDEDDNVEGISLGGFNVVIKDGIATVLSYDNGVTVSNTKLMLNSDLFDRFNVRMDLSGTADENPTLALRIITADNNYAYTKDIPAVGQQCVYSFDISDVNGTITGFVITPSAKECQANVDWIEFERKALDSDTKLDKVIAINDLTVDAKGFNYEIESLTVEEGKTFKFLNGTLKLGAVSGNGSVVSNGCIIYSGTDLDGYVSFDVGAKTATGNLRYAEVDGEQYKFDGNTYGMILGENETKLVQIVEKTSDDAVVTVSTKYFVVNGSTATELNILENAMNNVDELSLRTKDPVGVRFKARIANTAKVNSTVTEYGFVIALERDITKYGKQLNLDFPKKAMGSAYVEGSKDVIYDVDSNDTFFTAVLYNIPSTAYNVKLVAKTFTKLSVDGKTFVVYGEPITASPYQIAKAIKKVNDLDDDAKAFIDGIINEVEGDNDSKVDYGDL